MKSGAHETAVVVTGGAGFIGSHCCKELHRQGFLPVVVDNLSTGHARAVRWGPLVKGDVRDASHLRRVLEEVRPVAVIHFAASAYVGESVSDPAKYYANNVGGMIALLDACLASGIGRVVFSSSCATYGVPKAMPITETTPQRPINPYGRTKLVCENILADHASAYGLSFVALRYFNACGADPEGEIGEWHDPETHLIPRALMAAFGHTPSLDIFGGDYPTPDGTCIRDFIHVCDLARAHVLALSHLLSNGASACMNLGSGRGNSILDVLSAVQRITGRTVARRFKPRREGDPPVLVADTELARSTLGFTPTSSDLDTIIRTAAPFFRLSLAS